MQAEDATYPAWDRPTETEAYVPKKVKKGYLTPYKKWAKLKVTLELLGHFPNTTMAELINMIEITK